MVYYSTAEACVVEYLSHHLISAGKRPMRKSKPFTSVSPLRVLCFINIHQFETSGYVEPAMIGDTPIHGLRKKVCTRCTHVRYTLIK